MAANDVPEYLNELIPYRCPKCGHTRRFATLRELRQHLQAEHSFQMGFIKPRARAQVFRGAHESTGSSNFARSLSSEEKFSGTSSKYESDPVNELYRNNDKNYNGSKSFRETSPLLKSFKEETEVLEKELQQARQNEMRHKAQSMRALNESYVNSDFITSLGSLQRTSELSRSDYPENFQRNSVEKTKTKTPLLRGQFGSSNDFKSTLDSLNTEVMKSRMNQWVTTDALYKSQDLLKEMETAAETKCQEQRKIIETLVQEMKAKDVMLQSRTKDQAELTVERQRLLDETESLVKQTDDYNTRLMQELNGRGKVLDGLNKELESLKAQAQQEIMTKDQDLQHATQKVSKLEWERERLIQETDRILKQADEDTGRLRRTLQSKEEELKNVNEIINQLRSQQQCMLEKTMTVYRSSEESRDIMKTAIQTKDSQLQHAMKQIENMTSLHKRLLEQSQILTDQADDNTSSMKRLLHAKGDQIRDLVQQIENLKREKRNLEDSTLSMAERAESSMSVVESLRDMVRQKESDLKTTQSELHSLKSFLKSAADKERVARQKLEVFIEDLIQRAETAESELHTLKSQSTDSFNVKREENREPLSDKADESSERRSLPSRIEPFNSRKITNVGEEKRDTFYDTRTKEPIQKDKKDKKSSTNLFVTTADVHHTNPTQNRNIEISNYVDDARKSNDTVKPGGNERTQLEESGGFVAREESVNCESDDDVFELKPIPDFSEDVHDAKHINHSKKDPCYSKIYTNDKSNDSDFPSRPHEWVDKVQKRYSRKRERKSYPKASANTAEKQNEDLQKSGKYCANRNINTSGISTEEFETQSHSESDYCYLKENKTKKISKGMQVGAFLSTQEIGNTRVDSSEYLQTASSDENYVDSENKTGLRRYIPSKNNKSARYMKKNDKRPVTMGKSNQRENNSKEAHLKSPRRKKRSLNREFDTRFPTAHKSMLNIASDRMDLSEGEVVIREGERQRRSRSLSPRVFGTITSHQAADMVESSSDTSLYEEMPNEIEDADMKIGEEDWERTDGVFKNIMDENGILWDDDDMATLPDVSDSEFDRVSPSGSEAIATKNTSTTAFSVHPGSTKTTESKYSPLKLSVDKKGKLDAEDMSISSVANLLNRIPNECIKGSRSHQNTFPNRTVDRNISHKRLKQKAFKKEKLDKNSDETSIDSPSNRVRFRPIKSPLYSKTSTSEKDQTSGGKEVRKIMESSPKIDILGTSASGTQSRGNRSDSSERHSENTLNEYQIKDTKYRRPLAEKMSQDNSKIVVTSELPAQKSYKSKIGDTVDDVHCNKPLRKESITDRIDRISSKYSPNQKTRLTEHDKNPQMDLEEKIKSINNKYKIKRDNIVHGKGLGNGVDMSSNKNSTELSVSLSKTNISFDRETERNQGITNSRTVHGMSDINVSNTRSSSYASPPSTLANGQQLPYAFIRSNACSTRLSENYQHPMGYPYMPYPVSFPYPKDFTSYPPFQQFQFHPEYLGPLPQVWNEHSHQSQSHLAHTQPQQKSPNFEPQLPRTQQQPQQKQQEQEHEHISFETPHKKIDESVTRVESARNKEHETKTSTKANICEEKEIKKSKDRENTNIVKDCDYQVKSCLHEEKTPILMTESDNENKGLSLNAKTQSCLLKTAEGLPRRHTDDISHINQQLFAANGSDMHVGTMDDRQVKQEILSNSEKIKKGYENSDSLKDDICYGDQENAGKSCNETLQNYLQNVTEECHTRNISPATSVSNAEVNHRVPAVHCSEKGPKLKAHLGLFDDTDGDESGLSLVNKSGLFAEEIGEESSIEYDSNTQSYLDLPGNGTDTDIDTDTESVRREFYEKTQKIKELVDGSHNDFADVHRHKVSRNTTSSASSQASIEIVERIPLAKREQVKQRRAALVSIFSFLDTRTLSRVAQVCREWRIVSRSPKLWRRVELRGEKISPQFLRYISRRCSQLRILILEDLHPRNRKATESVEDFQKNIRCCLESGYEQILKKAEASLHTIIITNCGNLLSAKCLWIASCCCRMLKHVTYLSDFDPVNAEVMWALGTGCRELKTLKCQPIFPCAKADNFTTKCAQLIGKCFRDLETVSLGGLIVDVTALVFIAKQCLKLSHLELHHMKFIKCEVIDEMCLNGLQYLRSIQFHATPIAPGALTVLHGDCKYLEDVCIEITETDFNASVGDSGSETQIPEYHEILDGYEALQKQPSLCNILSLQAERPTRPQETTQPVPERSFFDRLFR